MIISTSSTCADNHTPLEGPGGRGEWMITGIYSLRGQGLLGMFVRLFVCVFVCLFVGDSPTLSGSYVRLCESTIHMDFFPGAGVVEKNCASGRKKRQKKRKEEL